MSGEIGYGTTIAFSDTEEGVYTDANELTDITLPATEVNDVDKTHYLSLDFFREFTPGLGNAGELTFKGLFSKAELTALWAILRLPKWWRVQFPLIEDEASPSYWKCAGYLRGVQGMNPLDDKMEVEFKVKFSGKPTFTEGA